jgi:glycine dehydrogenase subunit 1
MIMRYLPHTSEDIAAMLKVVGADSLDGLFSTIPDDCCSLVDMNLPEPLSEWDLNTHMGDLAATMAVSPEYKIFLGAGSYDHFIPEAVRQLLLRSEVFTAYTPYQPEISQGTLQTIYEYQTLVTRLLGMDVANASMYDGASGLAEALLMAIRVTRRKKVAVSTPFTPSTVGGGNLFCPTGFEVVELPYGMDGRTDLSGWPTWTNWPAWRSSRPTSSAASKISRQPAKSYTPTKNPVRHLPFPNPWPTACSKAPAACGADIACGEGQSLGIPRSSAARVWACLPPSKSMSAACPAGWSAKPRTATAKPGSY